MIQLDPQDKLYRRLHRDSVKNTVVTSGAFKVDGDYPSDISVDIAKLLGSPEEALRTRPSHGIGEITVGDVLSLDLQVHPDPLPDNVAHALIRGNTRAKARILAERTRVLIPPRPDPS